MRSASSPATRRSTATSESCSRRSVGARTARAHLEEAIRLAPASAQAHSNLGNALAAEGRLDEATAAVSRGGPARARLRRRAEQPRQRARPARPNRRGPGRVSRRPRRRSRIRRRALQLRRRAVECRARGRRPWQSFAPRSRSTHATSKRTVASARCWRDAAGMDDAIPHLAAAAAPPARAGRRPLPPGRHPRRRRTPGRGDRFLPTRARAPSGRRRFPQRSRDRARAPRRPGRRRGRVSRGVRASRPTTARRAPISPPSRRDRARDRRTPRVSRGLDAALALALVAVTLALYAPVRHHEFLNYDDPEYVSANPIVRRGLTTEGVRWALTSRHQATWHPLTSLSHLLDVTLFGLDPGAHLLVNVVLHGLAAVILFLVLHAMTGARWTSAWVAALFAMASAARRVGRLISERKDVPERSRFWIKRPSPRMSPTRARGARGSSSSGLVFASDCSRQTDAGDVARDSAAALRLLVARPHGRRHGRAPLTTAALVREKWSRSSCSLAVASSRWSCSSGRSDHHARVGAARPRIGNALCPPMRRT